MLGVVAFFLIRYLEEVGGDDLSCVGISSATVVVCVLERAQGIGAYILENFFFPPRVISSRYYPGFLSITS